MVANGYERIRITCPDCGHHIDVGFRIDETGSVTSKDMKVYEELLEGYYSKEELEFIVSQFEKLNICDNQVTTTFHSHNQLPRIGEIRCSCCTSYYLVCYNFYLSGDPRLNEPTTIVIREIVPFTNPRVS